MTDIEKEIGRQMCIGILNRLPESLLKQMYDGRYDRLVRDENNRIIDVVSAQEGART